MRAISLALARPRMVLPRAQYARRPLDGILVLQRGENASTDYYLRPRLASAGIASEVLDLRDDPSASSLLGSEGGKALMVIFCRYAAPAWLEALEQVEERLARVVFFADDDLPEMLRDRDMPRAARGKVALHFAAHVERLDELCSELWVSTPRLAERFGRAQVLGPLPEAEPPEPSGDAPLLVAYHGTDVHQRERRFVLDVARRVPDLSFEIAGDEAIARAAAALPNIRIVPQCSWSDYLKAQSERAAAISLAPLFSTALNEARAPVKAFDAARLGAAGLYADAPAYRGFVRHGEDGLLLPMQPDRWAAAIRELSQDPNRRLDMAKAARSRLKTMLRTDRGFPAPFAE